MPKNPLVSNDVKLVFRIATASISELPIDRQISVWRGLVELLPEESDISAAARRNLIVATESQQAQADFFRLLDAVTPSESAA